MNISSVFGVFLGIGIIYASIFESKMEYAFFLNFHGVVIVVGGTLAAASISFPLSKILSLFKVFTLRVLGQSKIEFRLVVEQLLDLNKRAANGPTALAEALPNIRFPFLKEAVGLVAAGVLTEKEIRAILEQRLRSTEARFLYEANMFRSIGRFPPAFGLLATTLGMISLLQKLGAPGAEKLIGPAMSIGLVGTLYGIALANLVFIPISENLTHKTEEEMTLRRLVLEGAILLKQQVNPLTMRESLNSFLPPGERVTRKAA